MAIYCATKVGNLTGLDDREQNEKKNILQCRPEVLHPQSLKDSVQLQERLLHTHIYNYTRLLETDKGKCGLSRIVTFIIQPQIKD